MTIDFHSFIHSKYAKWTLYGLSFLFVLFILFEFYRLLTFQSGIKAELKQPERVISTSHPSLRPLKHEAFFGDYVPDNLNASQVKQSMLNLKLAGIAYSKNPEKALAIIQGAGGVERFYRINDKLPGGAVIKRILPDAVIIEHAGDLERLSLPEKQLKFEKPSKPLL